jgi:hypothetical protein
MVSAARIERLLRQRELKFFRAVDGDPRWIIPFQEGHLSLMLDDDGDNLLFRTSSIVNLEGMKLEQKASWWQAAMALNDRIRLGRWVGYEAIHFELPICLEGNARLTEAQFQYALAVATASLATGRERLEEMRAELPSTQVSSDPLGIFSQRGRASENN